MHNLIQSKYLFLHSIIDYYGWRTNGGVRPKDWGAMNRAPVDRVFQVDIRNNTPTMTEVCAKLKKQYRRNPFALAQIALFDTEDEIGQLHSELMRNARQNLDTPPSYGQLKSLLLKRFPELGTLSEDKINLLIEKNTYG